MTSLSKDGDIAAKISSWIANVHPTRGSSSKGGRAAMNELIKICNETHLDTGLTIDGPRGPKFIPKKGIFKIAYECNTPIIPYYGISSRTKVLKRSWDKFRLGLPFSTMYIYYGKPILIESLSDESIEKYAKLLKEGLFEIEKSHFQKYPKHASMIESQE